MNVGPMLQRELRRQSRQGSTFWLRVLAGGLVLAACFWGLAWTSATLRNLPGFAGAPTLRDGRILFTGLNKLLALLFWFIAPLLTADCLANEKRDDTLGLLFLTPLRPADIVVGQAMSHTIRVVMLLLAAYPVLLIPVLQGGIGWADGARMLLLQLSVLGLALAAGVTASALTREWFRARLLALLFTAAASVIFLIVYLGLWSVWYLWRNPAPSGPKTASFLKAFGGSIQNWLGQNLNEWTNPGALWRGGAPSNGVAVLQAAVVLVVCWSLVWLAIRFAAAGLARTWALETSPPRPNLLTRAGSALTRARMGSVWLRSHRRRLLDRSPIAWLHGGRWTARLGVWIWTGLAAPTLVAAIMAYPDLSWSYPFAVITLAPLILAVAFSAAASFQRERESGALELLLVTPVSPTAILLGRLYGLSRVFGPALLTMSSALLIGVTGSTSMLGLNLDASDLWWHLLATWWNPVGVAILGLGFGLRWHGFMTAWYRALAGWYLIPYAAGIGAIGLISLADLWLDTGWNAWSAYTSGGVGSGWPTLLGRMSFAWWWFFMGLVTIVRIWILCLAWRMGRRALAERLFLPKPKQAPG